MVGKVIVIIIILLVGLFFYEYYIGHLNLLFFKSVTKIITTTSKPQINIVHYYNISVSINIYANNSGKFIYPISLPAYGNVTVAVNSSHAFNLNVYNNQTLISEFTGSFFKKNFTIGGKLELEFYNFTGTVNIQVSEEW